MGKVESRDPDAEPRSQPCSWWMGWNYIIWRVIASCPDRHSCPVNNLPPYIGCPSPLLHCTQIMLRLLCLLGVLQLVSSLTVPNCTVRLGKWKLQLQVFDSPFLWVVIGLVGHGVQLHCDTRQSSIKSVRRESLRDYIIDSTATVVLEIFTGHRSLGWKCDHRYFIRVAII